MSDLPHSIIQAATMSEIPEISKGSCGKWAVLCLHGKKNRDRDPAVARFWAMFQHWSGAAWYCWAPQLAM